MPSAGTIRGVTGLTVGFLALGGAALFSDQTPQQIPGAFRSTVTLVPVDVRVLDRNGRPVTDLTAGDFTLVEDDIRQEIAHFSARALTAVAPDPDSRPMLRRTAGLEDAPINRRTFLVVFGRGRLQEPAKGIDGLLEFLREHLLPQDQAAVVAYNRATDLTTDHDQISRVIERLRHGHEVVEAALTHFFNDMQLAYGSREIPPHIQSTIDKLFSGTDLPPTRELPPTRIPDDALIIEDFRRALDYFDPNARDSDARFVTGFKVADDLLRLYTAIEYLRYLEGEKHLIFVTEQGLVGLPRAENGKTLADVAADARVAVHTIQTGGVPTHFDISRPYRMPVMEGRSWSEAFAMTDARELARRTGGMTSFYAYARKAVDRIDKATRFHYVLGYSPSNASWDGKYRRIHVRVNRPDVQVLFRHGYFARELLVPYDRRQFMTYNRMESAGSWAKQIKDIPVTLETSVSRQKRGISEVRVQASIDPAAIRFKEDGGQFVATIDVATSIGDAAQHLVGEHRQTLDLSLDAEGYERVKREGITYTAIITATKPARHVKVVVYDYAADKLGTVAKRLD